MDAHRPAIRASRHAMASEFCFPGWLRFAILTDGGDQRRSATMLER